MMIYSSGTTGRPKGILLSHRGVVGNAIATRRVTGQVATGRFITLLPLTSSFGFEFDFLMPGLARASTVVIPRFDPAVAIEAIQRHRVTYLTGVPTVFARLFEASNLAGRDIASVRMIDVGGGPVSPTLKSFLGDDLGIETIESYGLTELSSVASVQVPGQPRRNGSCGPAIPGVEVRVVDEFERDVPAGESGELLFRGSTFMIEYW